MIKNRVIVAIESSCDDTSVAIIKNNILLSNVTFSSTNEHKKYGGIVPELASRSHCTQIDKAFKQSLKDAKINLKEIDYIAYTSEPGLIGSLHVGKVFAQQLASLLNKPIIKVNHMLGHAFSYFIDHDKKLLKFPLLSLVVSGGHTFIARVTNFNKFTILNETVDDAAGETLDKIGRYLNLEYPGGIAIDKIYDAKKVIRIIDNPPLEAKFSFSGIKTACLNMINSAQMKKKKINPIVIGSSALEWITDDLINKLKFYLGKYKDTKIILVGGGVSANKLLRNKLSQIKKIPVYYPTLKYTNDNAAMIAAYANFKNNF